MRSFIQNCIRFFSAVLAVFLVFSSLTQVYALADAPKLRIVTTVFPVYDWIREILGNQADRAEITMLLDSGADLHNYQPSAPDIMKIKQADCFIYIGGESDEWVDDVLSVAANPDRIELNLMEALGEDVREEELVEGMETGHHDHDEEDHDHDEEETEYDEHIWLSLRNAGKLVQTIAGTLAEKDPEAGSAYQQNAAAYAEKLGALDQAYEETVFSASRKTLLFADRFPFRYLAADYGLTYYAAFSGCSAESEASFETVVFLAKKVDELDLPVVLTIENPKSGLAETVVQTTKSRNQQILHMNSLQSVTSQDLNSGVSYLSVMTDNLEVLKEALQ